MATPKRGLHTPRILQGPARDHKPFFVVDVPPQERDISVCGRGSDGTKVHAHWLCDDRTFRRRDV